MIEEKKERDKLRVCLIEKKKEREKLKHRN
jgi:hypothetical protein